MNQTTAGREVPTACGGGIWFDSWCCCDTARECHPDISVISVTSHIMISIDIPCLPWCQTHIWRYRLFGPNDIGSNWFLASKVWYTGIYMSIEIPLKSAEGDPWGIPFEHSARLNSIQILVWRPSAGRNAMCHWVLFMEKKISVT